MKKILTFVLALLMVFSVLVFTSCSSRRNNVEVKPKTGMFYKVNGYADKVYAIDQNRMSEEELTTAISIQGVLAQEKAAVYIYGSEGATMERLTQLSERKGFTVVPVGSVWELVDLFADKCHNKYVLYNDFSESSTMVDDQSINYATTICGAEGWMMISRGLEQTAKMYGLSLGEDATDARMSTRFVFETYKNKLNNSFLIHQSPQNRNLRDYAIAGKAMCFYADFYDGDSSVKADILAWARTNAPILGWTENEVNFVSANSLQSIVTVAADHAVNLSLYCADSIEELIQAKHTPSKLTAEKGKHYVAIVMSDGDNVQWMTRGFTESTKYFGSSNRGRFPMTWTTSPALYDLAPSIIDNLYGTATQNDLFIAGPSGVGYVNAAEYNPESIDEYAAYTAGYMQATDMHYINFLDNTADKTMLDHFSSFEQVRGGVWSVGNKYIEGEGAVYWSNNKPFICARETLWRIPGDDRSNKYYGFVERVAQRINEYSTDPTKIEGYTVVLAHAWSVGSMDYINRFVKQLDEDVVLVTVDQLIDLVSANVAHTDATPKDITPQSLDDRLVPISSEQYTYSEFADIPVSNVRDFTFSDGNLMGWRCDTSGLEYDFCGIEKNAIMLDGSDLDDVIDPLPNAWTFNKFALSNEPGKDNWLTLFVSNGEGRVDVNMRVRVLYQEEGQWRSVLLTSSDYDKTVNEYGYLLYDYESSPLLNYDISRFKGETIIISIEQDDTGDGTGEVLYVNQISIVDEFIDHENAASWTFALQYAWDRKGTVSAHSEGVCLESAETASLSRRYTVTQATQYVKIYVRTFERPEDIMPTIKCTVDEVDVNPIGQTSPLCMITNDLYACFVYDLSDYIGSQVTFSINMVQGDHACIGRIDLTPFYSVAETQGLYTAKEIGRK